MATHHRPHEPFADIVRRHQAAVCAAAYGVTGDRALAEDVAQETFLAAWRGLPTLRDPARLAGWLCGIARNLARKAQRRRRRPAALEDCAELAAADDPAHDIAAVDEARLAWAALRELPRPYREALVLYYWEGRSARRVAEALGITEATAMQRLSRGRARLRAQLLRRVEGTLRRARPGAALTAAILAAVSAAATRTAAAGAATAYAATAGATSASTAISGAANTGVSSLASGLSRRVICRAGLTLLGSGALGALSGALVAWSGRRRASDAVRPARDASASTQSFANASSTAAHRGADVRSPAMVAPERPRTAASPDALDPLDTVDDLDSYGDPMSSVVASSDLPAESLVPLNAALSLCFVDELVDHPCGIEIEVRGGKIATTRVEPFDGASRRVVVRTLQNVPTALAPTELIAWLAADKLITAVRDDARLADHAQAMTIGEFIELCATARLEGLPLACPDGTRHLRFGWVRDVPRPVDHAAYADLGVATGASIGPATAPVTVVSFLDVAGSRGFGGKSLATWREVLAKYPRDVRLVVKLCPQCPDHELAAEAIYAAGAQHALWPMLELVATNPDRFALDDLISHASSLGLDASRLRADLVQRSFRDAVERDRDQMMVMDIDSLPSALVNGARCHGALPAATCTDAVERALRRPAHAARTWPPGDDNVRYRGPHWRGLGSMSGRIS